MSRSIDLSKAKDASGIREKSKLFEALWMIFELSFIYNPVQVSSRLRVIILRIFGAKIGKKVIIRQRVRIKYPWKIEVGDHCWIGESAWIHNQEMVYISDNVVISQGCFITTGSHDTRSTMDLIVKPVYIESGAWITSKSVVLQGVRIGKNTIVTPASVVHRDLESDGIYGGNPVKYIKKRQIE